MNWVLNRLREASTWRGLVWLLTVSGVALRPDQVEAIVLFGMALAGLLGVFLKDEIRSPETRTRETDWLPIELQGRSDSGPGLPRAIGVRVDVPPGHYTAPDLDERGSPSGFNDQ